MALEINKNRTNSPLSMKEKGRKFFWKEELPTADQKSKEDAKAQDSLRPLISKECESRAVDAGGRREEEGLDSWQVVWRIPILRNLNWEGRIGGNGKTAPSAKKGESLLCRWREERVRAFDDWQSFFRGWELGMAD